MYFHFLYILLPDIQRDMEIIDRRLSDTIKRELEKYPIVALTGPRQSGKTTLLKHLFPGYTYISLENHDLRTYATEDPNNFLREYSSKVIIDEAQQVPQIFSYLQTHVDENQAMGQYILSGSQNFHLLANITQSLAGRVSILKLLPFDISELENSGILPSEWESLILKGSYPAIYHRDIDSPGFYSNYIQTYINRDISQIINVHNTRLFKNFLSLCASRTGQMLNLNNMARECGISFTAAKSWLSILESSYIVFLLHPYYENFKKRIIKSPKLYFFDTGVAAHLLGLKQSEDLSKPALRGALFENLIMSEIQKQNYHLNQLKEYWFWRDSNGHELDLMEKHANEFDIFEIKSTRTINPKLVEGLNYFDKITDGRVKSKTLIYGGDETQDRSQFKVRNWKSLS
jgi:predicted AAA+ superfamily ATPase